MNGTVKWFNRDKGYGFISGEDGKDYFVHWKQVPEGMILNENDAVSFDAVQADKGMQAQNIRPAEAGSEAAPAEEETPEDDEDFGEEEDTE